MTYCRQRECIAGKQGKKTSLRRIKGKGPYGERLYKCKRCGRRYLIG